MRKLDVWILGSVLALTAFGMFVIYSTGGTHYLTRQLVFLPIAVAGLVIAYLLPRNVLLGLAVPFYGIMLVLLIAVLFLGKGAGSRRWFMLGPLAFQPSEFAKLATMILLARHLAAVRVLRFSVRSLFWPVVICLAPALLILAEPDLSAALLLGAVLAAMLYWQGLGSLQLLALYTPLISFTAGFSLWTWIPFFLFLGVIMFIRTNLARALVALTVGSLFGLLSPALLSLLKEYQRARVRSFLAPWLDPNGVGWNAVQSRIAVGSGRLTGKGYLGGTQSRLGFLPNRHTDFVFSCIAEEFGFVGSVAVLGLFALIIRRFLVAARYQRDRFASLVAVGCAAIIGYQVFVNIAMLLGLMPVTGVALPFLSYGGSSLVVSFITVGLVLNVAARKQ